MPPGNAGDFLQRPIGRFEMLDHLASDRQLESGIAERKIVNRRPFELEFGMPRPRCSNLLFRYIRSQILRGVETSGWNEACGQVTRTSADLENPRPRPALHVDVREQVRQPR